MNNTKETIPIRFIFIYMSFSIVNIYPILLSVESMIQ